MKNNDVIECFFSPQTYWDIVYYYKMKNEENFLEKISFALIRNFPKDYFYCVYMSFGDMNKLCNDLKLKKRKLFVISYFLYKSISPDEKYKLSLLSEELEEKKENTDS